MYALISDLHSNIEAVDAVLEDIASFNVDAIYCLGDVIGYGPNPVEVLGRVEKAEFILQGNHEGGLLHFAEDFNPRAREALEWTRDQLNDANRDKEIRFGFWQRLDEMETLVKKGDDLFVHGSLRNHTKDYLMPGDIADTLKMEEIWESLDGRACFAGHTHIPGVWTQTGKFLSPTEISHEFVLPDDGEKVCINVGSVGQPRDNDTRSCYVIVDDDKIIWRRVEYDNVSTMRKILKIDRLSDTLAARLKVGR